VYISICSSVACKGLESNKDEKVQFSEENMQLLKVKHRIVLTEIRVRVVRAIYKIRKFDANGKC